MKSLCRRLGISLTHLVLMGIFLLGGSAVYASEAVLTHVKAKESEQYIHVNPNGPDYIRYECQENPTVVRWDYTWPDETAYPTEKWTNRVAIQWDWDETTFPANAQITGAQLEVGIGSIAMEYPLTQVEVRERPSRIPPDNLFPAPGEPGWPPCEAVWQVMTPTIYAAPAGWDAPNSRKTIVLSDQAVHDIKDKVRNTDTRDDFFAVVFRSTQEENYYGENGGDLYCVWSSQGGWDCTDAVQLAGPFVLTISYEMPIGGGLKHEAADTDQPADPATFTLLGNEPNPFSRETLIRYNVPAAGGEMKLAVYDVRGSLVRTLVDGAQTPGEQAVVWDGRGSDGRPAAAGIYFYRLESGDALSTRKMILTK